MKSLIFISLIVFVSSENTPNDVQTKMEENGIVPDLIDKAPSQKLQVYYGPLEVNLGNELTPLQTKDEPSVNWDGDDNTYYTLLMVDPDAPSRQSPTNAEGRHWFVGNIKGTNWKTGDDISEYFGPAPPKGSGLHRYVFLIYKQKEKIHFKVPRTSKNSRAHRLKFSTRDFAKKYDLGDPIAGNFFQAQWDEYVEISNKNNSN